MRTIAAALMWLFLGTGIAHADPTPTRCKDVPSTFGSSHVCQFPDGSITSVLPVVGPPCSPVLVQLAPNFWD